MGLFGRMEKLFFDWFCNVIMYVFVVATVCCVVATVCCVVAILYVVL